MGFSVLGFSVPVFVIGYILIYLFAVRLGWLPVQGYQRIADGVSGFLLRLILPSITLAVVYVALIARITRASVLEVLGADYVRTARAKGLGDLPVLARHVVRNAAVPIVTVIGLGVALLIGGVVVTESVYSIPGLGRLTVDASSPATIRPCRQSSSSSRWSTCSSTSSSISPTSSSTRASGTEPP
jgi:peptide/nickel transport system permease protein